MAGALGARRWAIAEGYIPGASTGEGRGLNAEPREACVEITVYFADRDPAGPFKLCVPGRRTLHLRFNDLEEPESIPVDTDFASVIESDVPIVVQHTRLDSRQPALALLSTIAFPSP